MGEKGPEKERGNGIAGVSVCRDSIYVLLGAEDEDYVFDAEEYDLHLSRGMDKLVMRLVWVHVSLCGALE